MFANICEYYLKFPKPNILLITQFIFSIHSLDDAASYAVHLAALPPIHWKAQECHLTSRPPGPWPEEDILRRHQRRRAKGFGKFGRARRVEGMSWWWSHSRRKIRNKTWRSTKKMRAGNALIRIDMDKAERFLEAFLARNQEISPVNLLRAARRVSYRWTVNCASNEPSKCWRRVAQGDACRRRRSVGAYIFLTPILTVR